MMILMGLFILAVGLTMLLKPEWIWHLTESWKSNDGTEPSDLYLWSTRIGGGLFMLAGTAGIIAFFFS